MPNADPGNDGDSGGHLDDVPDGCGCTEIWEHLSDERRQGDGDSDEQEREEPGG